MQQEYYRENKIWLSYQFPKAHQRVQIEWLFLSVHLHGPTSYSFHSLLYCISYLVITLNQRSTSKVHHEFASLSTWCDKNDIVSYLPWDVVNFFHSSGRVLCFGFEATAALMPHQHFGCCWTAFTHHQDCPSSSAPPKACRLGMYSYCPPSLVLWWCYFDFSVGNFYCWCKQFLWKVCDKMIF